MKLFHRQIGEGPPLIILHGLFGSSDNWFSIAKRLTDNFTVYLLDLRNHGKSPYSDIHDYPSMIEDLFEFITDHDLKEPVLLGHSMGGKVVMKFAISYPEMVKKLIVAEMAPRIYKPRSKYLIEVLLTLDLKNLTSREEADIFLAEKIKNKEIRQFILKNLYRKEDSSFAWHLNLESLNKNLGAIGGYFTNNETFTKETLFLQGENSNYITDDDCSLIKRIFVNSEIVKISGAGHWIQTDKPELVFEAINKFLLKKV